MSNSHAATALVVGASGATGRLLVQQLLDRGLNVKAIVRSPNGVPGIFTSQGRLAVIQGSVLDLSDADLAEHVAGCVAV
nr:NAD(P)H-binding protein [Candidatus Krumholzibacteria bacterium]